jgi:branched-chain amino acid transport system substrate-binding protein
VALAGIDAPVTTSTWADYVESAGLPVIGQVNSDIWTSNPVFFASGTTQSQQINGLADAVKAAGADKMGLLACNIAVCTSSISLLSSAAEKAGITVVYKGTAPLATADYTAYCLAMKSAGAQAVYLAVGVPQNAVDQCAEQGYKPHWIMAAAQFEDSFLSDPNFNGLYGTTNAVPWFADTQGLKSAAAAIKQYEPSVPFNDLTVEEWAGLVALEQAAGHTAGTPTRASVLAGLRAFNGTTLGGLAPPLSFASNPSHAVPCSYLWGIKDGKLFLPDGTKPICSS